MKRVLVALSAGMFLCTPVRSDEAVPISRASVTADLLAAADTAAAGSSRASRRALGKTVAALDRIGARADEGQEEAIAGWRAQAGPAAAGCSARPIAAAGWSRAES